MTQYRDSKGQSILLTKKLASGGEGAVWQTNRSGYLAKLYFSHDAERVKKLQLMLANPPEDPTRSQNHVSIAWVQELLIDIQGNCVGFLMPVISQVKELLYVYNPQHRLQQSPNFNWYYLHATAYNVALIIGALHAKSYVIGDMNPKNLLVNDKGLISIIDVDSFQVTDSKHGKVYRCKVGLDGFIPPELLNKDLSSLNQTKYHDRFRLAVIIHFLLFGYHPFTGKWVAFGEQPEQNEYIRQGFWLYSQNSPLQATRNTIPLNVVHPEIQKLFLKCFNDGHTSPRLRPTAQDWCNALRIALSDLIACRKVANHSYSKVYGKCYWCEREQQLGIDIFPHVANAVMPSQAKQQSPQGSQTLNVPANGATMFTPTPSKGQSQLKQNYKSQAPITIAQKGEDWKIVLKILGIGSFITAAIPIIHSFFFTVKVNDYKYLTQNNSNQITQESTETPKKPVDSNTSPVYYQQGIEHYQKGNYYEAINHLNLALTETPHLSDNINQYLTESYLAQGIIEAKNGRHIVAIDNYNQAININSKHAETYYQKALAYRDMQKYEAAIINYNKAIDLSPQNPYYYNSRGVVCYSLDKFNLALENFNKAIEINSNITYFYSNRGRTNYQLKNYQAAIDDLTKTISEESKDGYYYNLRGFAYFKLDKLEAAINDFNKAIEINSKEPTFYTNRSGIYEQQGNISAAINDLEKAAALYLQQGNKQEYTKRINKIQILKSR
ncbi:MAG: tetratricopeptide repeat protein [Calothrix sp. FI2-JRJ7]|jgi:DNA-binding helix-hairpin-helix protein with protein kinase domain|nr:tetratricopeptide repeat protein [Calothrix sp. FI2-JRJ7]